MRKLAIVVAMAIAAAAQAAGQSTAAPPAPARGGATEPKLHDTPAATQADATKDERDRLSKDDFDVKGKAVKACRQALTLNRDDAPPVTLHVARATKIQVDGK
jgi:hypothetical protein